MIYTNLYLSRRLNSISASSISYFNGLCKSKWFNAYIKIGISNLRYSLSVDFFKILSVITTQNFAEIRIWSFWFYRSKIMGSSSEPFSWFSGVLGGVMDFWLKPPLDFEGLGTPVDGAGAENWCSRGGLEREFSVPEKLFWFLIYIFIITTKSFIWS